MIYHSRSLVCLKLSGFAGLSSLIIHLSSAGAGPAVTSVACGGFHSIFSKADGSLWTMGNNGFGQLGIGFTPSLTNKPQEIVSSGVAAVAGGQNHSMFRMGSSLWTMGDNEFGQLGDGTTNVHVFPEKIFSGTASVSVTLTGPEPTAFHSLFATSGFIAGSTGLRAMGDNAAGQLGDGLMTNHEAPEVVVSTTISAMAGGEDFSLFVKSDGSLWGMGDNVVGELGTGNMVSTNMPVQILSGGVIAVAAGSGHSLFIKSDGSLWGMGLNSEGELGDNSTSDKKTPEQLAFNGVIGIAAGSRHSLFVKSDGSLWGMGDNSHGQLGLGSMPESLVTAKIVNSNVVAVAAGVYHSLFIKSDGSLWGMGENSSGQLGDGISFANHLTPFQIVAGLPPAPRITGISLSSTNLHLNCANGVTGEIVYTLMSTNAARPLSQWLPVATNMLSTDGNFSITAINAVATNDTQQFYVLQAQ